MAFPLKHQILSEPLHSQALRHSLSNLNLELAGQSTNNPECIDEVWLSLPLLYCLHIERYKNQPDDFNIYHLRGWHYSNMIIARAEKYGCPLYKAWQHLMQTRFAKEEQQAPLAHPSKLEFVDLTLPEPRRGQSLSNISSLPIIDLVTPKPEPELALGVDLSTPKPDQLMALVVNLSTPEPDQPVAPVIDLSTPETDQPVAPVVDLSTPESDQLVAALSISARAFAVSQDRLPGLQLLTPELHRILT